MRVPALSAFLVFACLSAAHARDAARASPEGQSIPAGSRAAGCDIHARPGIVLKKGERVSLTWTMRNADSATISHDGKTIGIEPDTKSVVENPDRTTTYTMSVKGTQGTSACQVSVAVPERTQPIHWPPPPLAAMPTDYLERARASLAAGITGAALTSDQRWIWYAIPSLLFEQDVEAINRYFAHSWRFESNPVVGLGLFSMDIVRLYGLFNGNSGSYPGRLGKEAQRNIEEELYNVASRTMFNDFRVAADLSNVLNLRSSENHSFSSRSSFLLVSQFLKNSPEFANRTFEDGRRPAEHYAAWREYWSRLMDERAKRGMYVEVGSPSYEHYSRKAIQNIRDFSEDAILRQKAEILLDLTYALIAQETLANGVRGGAKSRVYSFRDDAWGGGEDRDFNLIFGPSGYPPVSAPQQATSSYFPPSPILRLGKNPAARGRYSIAQRVPGVGVTRDRSTTLDPSKSVYRYGFVTPSYVLGSFALDPEQPYAAMSAQNRWQGVVFNGDRGARIAPQITRLNRAGGLDREQRVANGFASVQDRNVLITQRSGSLTSYLSRTDIHFSSTLDLLEEEGGWIFVKEGDAYGAVRVVHEGGAPYRWLDPVHKNKSASKESQFVVLADPDSPIILVASEASDYDNDFVRFKSALKAQSVRREGVALRFANLIFNGPKRSDTGGYDFAASDAKTFDSPFVRSSWLSGVIYIREGEQGLLLDLSTPDHPVKRIDPPLTPAYPAGRGDARSIIFQSR